MPIAADRETRKPTPDTPAALSGRWLVDPLPRSPLWLGEENVVFDAA